MSLIRYIITAIIIFVGCAIFTAYLTTPTYIFYSGCGVAIIAFIVNDAMQGASD